MESWEETFRRISVEFARQLEAWLVEMESLFDDLRPEPDDTQPIKDLHRCLHRITGSAGTYGFRSLTELSLDGERRCHAILQGQHRCDVNEIEHLRRTVEEMQRRVTAQPDTAENERGDRA